MLAVQLMNRQQGLIYYRLSKVLKWSKTGYEKFQ